MKILNEKEIEYAVEKMCNERFGLQGKIKYGAFYEQGILAGATFAEQKLIPLMVEFSQWCSDKYLFYPEQNVWSGGKFSDPRYTTQQLLEQFIKSKQNESTEMS